MLLTTKNVFSLIIKATIIEIWDGTESIKKCRTVKTMIARCHKIRKEAAKVWPKLVTDYNYEHEKYLKAA
jgi:hypothetical protein